ncbi:MAG TPA: glycoside hydrolase domain-containing protein, partial [Phycisphaerae bacterium]|nr:glycoside hydrolase domain-containing protein [Phycisphaerae bacterium]
VAVLDAKGNPVVSGSLRFEKAQAVRAFELPGLPNGEYTVRTTLQGPGAPDKPFEKTFRRIHFVWEDNRLGISERVFPPFEPVRVRGDEARVVLRSLRMNGFGLWDRVVTKGKDLLAGPITVKYTTADGPGRFGRMTGRFTETKPTAARYEAAAAGKAVALKTVSTIEVDGCMKVRMELSPGAEPEEIAALWVDIPVKDELAPLWHVMISAGIRRNPVGAAPKGKGLIWDSTQTGNGAMLGTFLPYVWVGGPERGIAWFADNDRGWVVDDEKPALSLHREDGRLSLRVHLVNQPVTLRESRTVVFGLQASPTRPMPAGWRARTNVPPHGGSNAYWGILASFAGKFPAERDWSFVDELLIARRTRRVNHEFLQRWIDEKIKAVSSKKDWVSHKVRHVQAGMGGASTTGDDPRLIYFEEHMTDQRIDEFRVFQDEWGMRDFTQRAWATAPDESWGAQTNFTKSYQDFALWQVMQWNTRGLGIYTDNCYPRNCYNPLFSNAYVRADGQVQPSTLTWQLREYHKRMWVLEQLCQPLSRYPLMISNHMTNGHWLPVLTWGDTNLDIEWTWGTGDGPFPPEVLLAETIGLQTGNYPHSLYPVLGAKVISRHGGTKSDANTRTEWGMRFVHEILRAGMPFSMDKRLEALVRDFGYGDANCAVLRYYVPEDQTPATPGLAVDNDRVKWIGLWHAGRKELLVVLVNWARTPQAAKLTLRDPAGAKLAEWADAETGKPVPAAAVDLPKWGVRLLKIPAR